MELRAIEKTKKRIGSGPAWPVYKRILLAVDGSERSVRAGEHAVYLARSLGAELFVMSVGSLQVSPALRGIIYLAGISAEIEQESRDVAQSILESATERGIRCRKWPTPGGFAGSPFQAVAATAGEVGAECVVVGLSRFPGSNEAFSRASYEKLVWHVGCAVLSI